MSREFPSTPELMAREIMGRPSAHMVRIESLDLERDGFDGLCITLCDAPPLLSGKRKGQPNFRQMTNEQKRLIPRAEFRAWVDAWKAAGNCPTCCNSGEVFVRGDHIEGTTMKPCADCDRAPVAAAAELFGAAT